MSDERTNILVVDDLPENLLVYRTILDELGQNLITADSGEEALRAVLHHDFAVILLDVNMPGMNGLETAAIIRRRKRSAHTPIIFLTAFPDEMRAAEGYAQGAVDYLTTPVVPPVLCAKVRVFADLYRMTQQVRKQAEERIAFAEERTRREAAEEAGRRLEFLAHAGEVLGQSLDQGVTTRDVVRLPIPLLADTAALLMVNPASRPEEFTLAQAVRQTVEEGQGYQNLDPEMAAVMNRFLSGAEGAIEGERTIALPLRVQGRILAVLALSRAASGRRFTLPDIALAETFASRAATGLENARLYREVQQADQQKNEFLSMLAHELRNPLAPIRNANEVLRQNATDPTRICWAQGVIDRQITHLVRLVDDLLDVSRLTLGKVRLAVEPVALQSIVDHAIEASRPLIDQLHHQLDISVPQQLVHILGDPTRLTQILTNLLNNAAKYTPAGGRIWLTVKWISSPGATESAERASGSSLASVEIRVRDNGIGITSDLLPRVFDPFTQANRSLARSQGGLGIGLTLVRRLVEMHEGSVEAHSEGPGKGSEFLLRLPVIPTQDLTSAARPSAPTQRRDDLGSLRVVVVDDNLDGAESLMELLSLLGHQVQMAHDGPTGITTITEFQPDVVLLDIGLPGMNGFEVARQLRSNPNIRAALVAISGYGREEDLLLAREAGFDQHFVKPVDFDALQGFLNTLRLRGHAITSVGEAGGHLS